MSPAINALEIANMKRKIVHENSPVLNWNMANAVATTDSAGNRKLDKAVFRIDGAVALAMAMALRARDRGRVPTFVIDRLSNWGPRRND